jgi:hypothetical protein
VVEDLRADDGAHAQGAVGHEQGNEGREHLRSRRAGRLENDLFVCLLQKSND